MGIGDIATRARLFASRRVRAVTRLLPSRNAIGTIYRTSNGIFSIAASDIFFANALRGDTGWADHEVGMVRAATDATSRVLFVGAHIGTIVVPIARHVAQVVAIEANPDTFRFLSANIALNGLDNVVLHQLAAGEAEGTIEFVLNTENSGGAKRKPVGDNALYFYDKPKIVTVPMRPIDELLAPDFDTVVMDIEGSEYFALRGMQKILAGCKNLFVEFLPHHLRDVSGVNIDTFAATLIPHFSHLYVPSLDRHFVGGEIGDVLARMFHEDRGDDLIHFSKD